MAALLWGSEAVCRETERRLGGREGREGGKASWGHKVQRAPRRKGRKKQGLTWSTRHRRTGTGPQERDDWHAANRVVCKYVRSLITALRIRCPLPRSCMGSSSSSPTSVAVAPRRDAAMVGMSRRIFANEPRCQGTRTVSCFPPISLGLPPPSFSSPMRKS